MKKITLLALLLALVLALAACTASGNNVPATTDLSTEISSDNYDLTIREKMFVTQINEIYVNAQDYIGKRIHLEGMFTSYYYQPTDSTLCIIYRNGPGCCGTDGQVGFEIAAQEGVELQWPADQAWIEVIGILEEYEEDGVNYLQLRIIEMNEKEERGEETVLQ